MRIDKIMRKNGYRLISYKQYRIMDLCIFAGIMLLAEITVHFAAVWLPGDALFTVSFMLPIVLVIMVRWGWQSVFYSLGSAVLYCALNKGGLTSYFVYGIGNCFVMLMLLPLKFIGTEKIVSKWWRSLLLVLGAWMCVYLGRAVVWTVCYAVQPVKGAAVYAGFISFATSDLLSLAFAAVVVLVLRRFDGMFENQKAFLKRVNAERRDKQRRDEFGDEPIEIDEEILSILHRDDGLY